MFFWLEPCVFLDNGPIEIIQTKVEIFMYINVKQIWGASGDCLHKLEKHLASLVTRKSQDNMLIKSTSFKDKSDTHSVDRRDTQTQRKRDCCRLTVRCKNRQCLQLPKQTRRELKRRENQKQTFLA